MLGLGWRWRHARSRSEICGDRLTRVVHVSMSSVALLPNRRLFFEALPGPDGAFQGCFDATMLHVDWKYFLMRYGFRVLLGDWAGMRWSGVNNPSQGGSAILPLLGNVRSHLPILPRHRDVVIGMRLRGRIASCYLQIGLRQKA